MMIKNSDKVIAVFAVPSSTISGYFANSAKIVETFI